MNKCPSCNTELIVIDGDDIYNDDYLMCESCDGTFTYGFMDATGLFWDRYDLDDARNQLFDMFMSEEHSDAESYIYSTLEDMSDERIVNMMYQYKFVEA
jgi:hypothetical protein